MKNMPVPPDAVVVGYDGSTGSEHALDWAVDEALRRAWPLGLVNASGRGDARPLDPDGNLDVCTQQAVERIRHGLHDCSRPPPEPSCWWSAAGVAAASPDCCSAP